MKYSVQKGDSSSKGSSETRSEYSHQTVLINNVNRVLRPRCNKTSHSIKPIDPIEQPQLPLRKRFVIEMKRCENIANSQVVLVKWPSFPYWPAYITSFNGTSVHVTFFGDNRLALFYLYSIASSFTLFIYFQSNSESENRTNFQVSRKFRIH